MLLFILFVLGMIFTGAILVGIIYMIPKMLVIALAALAIFYIVDSIRRGIFD